MSSSFSVRSDDEHVCERDNVRLIFGNGAYYFHLKGQERWLKVSFLVCSEKWVLWIKETPFDHYDLVYNDWGVCKLIRLAQGFPSGSRIHTNRFRKTFTGQISPIEQEWMLDFYGGMNYEVFYRYNISDVGLVGEEEVVGVESRYSQYWFNLISTNLSGVIFCRIGEFMRHRRLGEDDYLVGVNTRREEDREVLEEYMKISGKVIKNCLESIGFYRNIVAWHNYFGKGSIDFTYPNLLST